MSAVDYYDVQGMIRDARSEIRGEIDRAIATERDSRREADDDIRNGLSELRGRIAELEEKLGALA